MDSKTLHQLGSLSSFVPFFFGYVVLYGAIDLIAYYGEFDVPIMYYVSFGEIVTYFVKDIFYIILHILLVGLLGYILLEVEKRGNKHLSTFPKEIISEADELKRLIKTVKETDDDKTKLKLLNSADTLKDKIKNSLLKLTFKTKLAKYAAYVTFAVLIIAIVIMHSWSSLNVFIPFIFAFIGLKYSNSIKIYLLIYLTTALLTSSFFNAKRHAKSVKDGSAAGVTFQLDDKIIVSDSSSYVIGKTEQFLFYHKSTERMTEIYPVERINQYAIPLRGDTP